MADRTQRARERGRDNPTHQRVRRTNPQIRAHNEARQRENAQLGGSLSRFGRQHSNALCDYMIGIVFGDGIVYKVDGWQFGWAQ
jgi:hypothetical protein